MDYFFLSSINRSIPDRLVVSYDIACQWSRNLRDRCNIYPTNTISNSPDLDVTCLVPKFHLNAHIEKCRSDFSFNYEPHVGRTDGEAPERAWSDSNGLTTSTREMGP